MESTPIWRKPVFILICCIVMVMVSYGTRQSFGLFMRPMSLDMGWGREVLSFAIATQNLLIGAGAPFAGALSARWGAAKTIGLGGALYAAGLFCMSQSTTPEGLFFSSGILGGLGLSGCGVPLIAGVVGQVAPARLRTTWIGLITGSATAGQLVMLPFAQYLLSSYDWVFAIVVMSVLASLILPIAIGMTSASNAADKANPQTQSIASALSEAGGHRGFLLLTLGFYVCGFQVQFIGSHAPAYIVDRGGTPEMGAMALMLECAGIGSGGPAGRLRAKGLAGVYGATLRAWFRDDSPDLSKTMSALDHALARAERAARVLWPGRDASTSG